MALSKITNASVADTAVHGRRNLIINGSQIVAQRGTSFSSISSATYPVDRFLVQDVNGSAGEATVSQSTTAPDDFKYSLKVDVTTADAALVAADQYKIEYRAEGQDVSHLNWGTSAAKTVTLSFWVRSNKTGNTQVALLNSANDRSYVATFTIDAADTWEKKELTVAGDTSGTWLTTNGIGLRLRWGSYGSTYQTSSTDQWIGSQAMSRDDSPINFFDSTSNDFYLTGVQLEVGDASPFEHRSYGEELAACQRYYQVIGNSAGRAYSSTQAETYQQTQVPLRATNFSLSLNSGVEGHISGVSAYTLTAVVLSSHSTSNFVARVTTSGNWNSYIGTVVGFLGSAFICDSEL